MRRPLHHLISFAILLGWMAPSVGALGVGMHLASEPHGPHGIEHPQQAADLVRAVTHGHHHDLETTPDHRHDARFDGQAPALGAGLSPFAALPAVPSLSAALAKRSAVDRLRRRGPPTPLFTANCSLLL